MKMQNGLLGVGCLALGLSFGGCGGHLSVGNDSHDGAGNPGVMQVVGGMSGEGGVSGASTPELPLASTPGQIRCDSAVCDSQSEYCCSGASGSGNGGGFETCSLN